MHQWFSTALQVSCGIGSLCLGEKILEENIKTSHHGPYGSWYGHYKLQLDNPLAVTTQPGSEPKLRPVPKTVVNQIRDVVKSFPEGISIPDLHSELEKTNMNLDIENYRENSCSVVESSVIKNQCQRALNLYLQCFIKVLK
ncbi:hypothetical protein POM88_020832 [Heracleum sosnowskyi]|uniref:Uncharacterized protein n=1 Tax=Heracleum sosnowskyi TaxID=360622 RepID=A0AAD8IEP0_9APIA|nr:hypothetical protein POM88_020832 [Heracleum sosnowskyi]